MPVIATAQSPSRGGNVRDLEQNARASWQPVRDLSTANAKRAQSTQLKLAQHVDAEELPTPAPRPMQRQPMSVMQGPAPTEVIQGETIYQDGTVYEDGYADYPMDGQITVRPSHDGGCDGLPCGCGDGGCDGGCDSCGPTDCCSSGCCNGNPLCGEYNDCNSWRPCLTLCVPQDGWFSAEYLMWYQSGMDLPPLVSTDILPSRTFPGAPGTVLYGNDEVLTDRFDGARIRFGFWLDNCHTWGIGAEFFRIGQESESFTADGNTAATLGRPFINIRDNGNQDQQQVAFPGQLAGTVGVNVDSELQGWGLHLRRMTCASEGCGGLLNCGGCGKYCSRTEILVGYRNLQLEEGVRIDESLTSTGTTPTTFNIFDQFDTLNQFSGLDLGLAYKRTRGSWTFDGMIRLAVGNTRQKVNINGATVINTLAAQSGGLLAQNSNIGNYQQDEFSVLPELDLTWGYQITDQLKATVGYTFLYWSNVARPGDQIDLNVDPNQIPSNPAANPAVVGDFPRFDFDTTDYWAQGLSFGGEFRF